MLIDQTESWHVNLTNTCEISLKESFFFFLFKWQHTFEQISLIFFFLIAFFTLFVSAFYIIVKLDLYRNPNQQIIIMSFQRTLKPWSGSQQKNKRKTMDWVIPLEWTAQRHTQYKFEGAERR